ncbi:hypothetical protein Pcinc_021512 [Petrolisthes cinctipes]|uniref:Protein MMS22-like n=1 Tax=Petrolisthes cinctipes TaxID=88211 RepID=A0AAE1FHT0_PETCI|nr:hypothetical protein Pcinc_021512 [Petrolisthes cinctipes]
MTEAEISMTPPLTPPPPPWSQQQQQEMDDIMMDSDSLDYLDFFTTDTEPSHTNNNPHQGGVDSVESTGVGAVWFNCQGLPSWGKDVTLGSYLASGCLSSLIHHNTPSISPLPPPPSILQLPPCTPDNIHYLIHHYFMAIRHGISELERGAQSSFTPSLTPAPHTTQYAQLREDVAIFFTHLAAYTHSLKERDELDFLKQVDECVLGLLRYLGPLHHLQGHVTTAASPQGNKCPSAAYHLFHLHLDVRWWSLALLHTLPDHLNPSSPLLHELPPPPGGGVGGETRGGGHESFRQCASLVVWDLLHLLAVPTVKAGSSEVEDLVRWPCGCCVELAMSLLHLLDHRATQHSTQSFWEEARNKLLVLLKLFNDSNHHTVSTNNNNNNTSPKPAALSSCPTTSLAIQCPSEVLRTGSLTHIWWFFYNLARLYVYDVNGNTKTQQSEVKVEPKLLRTLVRLTVGNPKINNTTTTTTTTNTKPSETQLRSALRCCVLLCGVWGPGGVSWEWVGPLWEHFSRRFNDSFTLPGANMEAHTTASRTVGGWVEEVQRLGRAVNAWEPQCTSWQFFVTLLAGVARGGGGGGSMGSGWRQVRGRVYSRFHSRLMGELSSTGLHHAASLFLTLATVTDPLDVITKLCELLVLVPSRGSSGRMRVVWRSFLACALLLVGAGADLTNLTHKFTPLVASVVTQYTAARDSSTRRELGQLLVVYAEGVQEVFEESPDLSLSQHTLLCGSLAPVLPQVGISELKAVLAMLHTALAKVLTLTRPPHSLHGDGSVLQNVVGVVWSEFGGFLRTHSLTLTPPRTLGEVAACLTLCLSHLPPPSSVPTTSTNTNNSSQSPPPPPPPRDAAHTLVTHFLTSEAVNTGCSLHYGSWLLEHMDGDNLPWSGLEGQLIASWLCALVTQGAQDKVQEMSQRLTALPGVANVLPGPVSCPYSLARSLIRGVADKFSHLQNFNERMTYRERASQYFNGLDRAGTTLLKKTPPPSHLSRAIDTIADILLHAHQLIYAKSNPKCALPSLMSGVFLAAAVYCTEKTLPPPLTSAMAPALPKVVRGLGSLGLSRDAYLQRCVKEIFTHYLPRYPASITSLLSPTATNNTSHHTSTTPSHPILVCLEEREDVSGGMVKELRTIFLEVVRDAFLTRRSTSNTHTQIALSLVNEGIERMWVGWVEECCSVLLLPLLEILLSLDDHNTKRCTTHLLKQLLCRAQQSASPPRETMVGAVTQLVARHLSWSSGQVFRVLRVTGVMYRTLVLDALPYITRAVTTTEEKRGTGLDNTLRQGYQSLLSTLGVNNDVYQVG